MARGTLPKALELMFGHEGGYVNVKTDKGGPTKFGITHKTLAAHRGVAAVTADQVKAMGLDEATEIYRTGYWTQSGGDILPVGLDYATFDFGVNSGPARAVKVLQEVLGVAQDGNAGPETSKAAARYPGGLLKLIADYCEARMDFLRSLTNPKNGFPVNGRGWTRRVTGKDPQGTYRDEPGVIGNALALAKGSTVKTPEPVVLEEGAKAIPDAPNPWTKPEVLAPIGGVLPGLGALFAGSGPIQWALALGFVVVVGLGAFYAFKRIKATPA